jgi:hypothetical protein
MPEIPCLQLYQGVKCSVGSSSRKTVFEKAPECTERVPLNAIMSDCANTFIQEEKISYIDM